MHVFYGRPGDPLSSFATYHRDVAHVRPARPSDRDAVADVSFATGYFGRSAGRFFPDRTLFADLWIAPYFDGHGCCMFVAEAEGKVVGYIVGSCDTRAYQRHMARRSVRLAGRWLRGRYSALGRSVRFLLRSARYPGPAAPWRDYPAHLHINLLPEARGRRLGRALLEAYVTCLQERGVRGVQLSTTVENEAALGLYRSCGFRVYERHRSRLWRPWLGRVTTQVVMVKDLSTGKSEAVG